MAKGIFYIFAPLALVVVGAALIATFRGGSIGDDGLARVWSAAHGHWHIVLPDGSETEVKPGMVWDPAHGHFHAASTGVESARRYVTDELDQKIDDAETELAK